LTEKIPVPVIALPRRVPEALKSRLKAELDQMVKDQIISPVIISI